MGWLSRKIKLRRAEKYLAIYPDDFFAARAIIIMTEGLGTKSARNVAASVRGREFTDSEWDKYSEPWERAWKAIIPKG